MEVHQGYRQLQTEIYISGMFLSNCTLTLVPMEKQITLSSSRRFKSPLKAEENICKITNYLNELNKICPAQINMTHTLLHVWILC